MKYFPLIFVILFSAGCTRAQQVQISVTNPSRQSRNNEPVVIEWQKIGKTFTNTDPHALRLANEAGQQVELQVDDITTSGTPDELVFQDSYKAGETKKYILSAGKTPAPESRIPYHTDAQDWKRVKGVLQSLDEDDVAGNARERKAYRFDGVGWESDSMAYRLYLDERNAVDLLGKRKPGLYWKYIGTSGVDYQADADWGTDILHVGDALGVGGIGFWTGDSVLKPVSIAYQRCRIVSRGPVRAVVRVGYQGWYTGDDTVDLSSTFIIYRGDRFCEHRVELTKSRISHTIATGIVKHDSTEGDCDPAFGFLYYTGRQSRTGDSLMMAVCIPLAIDMKNVEGPHDHLLLSTIGKNSPTLRIFISAYWQGESSRMWTKPEIRSHLTDIVRRAREPLSITVTQM